MASTGEGDGDLRDDDATLTGAWRSGVHLTGREERRALTTARLVRYGVWALVVWTLWMVLQGLLSASRAEWFGTVLFLVAAAVGVWLMREAMRYYGPAGRYLATRGHRAS